MAQIDIDYAGRSYTVPSTKENHDVLKELGVYSIMSRSFTIVAVQGHELADGVGIDGFAVTHHRRTRLWAVSSSWSNTGRAGRVSS